jgi:hypothetical protein
MNRLRTRILVAVLLGLLLIVASGTSLALWLHADAGDRGQARYRAQLLAAQAEVESSLSEDLALRAAWIASDNASVAYIADALALAGAGQPVDIASISDLLGERRTQSGLEIVGVIDPAGRWVVGARPWLDSGGLPSGHPLFQRAQKEHAQVRGLVREEGRVFLGVIAPLMRAGAIEAWLYAARPLDGAWLARIAALAPAELAIVDTAGQVLAQAGAAGSIDETGSDRVLRQDLFGGTGPVVLQARLPRIDEAALLAPVLLFTVIGCAVWLLLVVVAWRSLLHPIDSACGLLERAAGGDFHLRAPAWRGGTRGRFASAFDALMARVGARPPSSI